MSDRLPVLVGELNPYGADAFFALYPFPPNASGGRLQRLVMGIPRVEYLSFPRYNLCYGIWNLPRARAEAARVTEQTRGHTLVLLGAKVCRAFGVEYAPLTTGHVPALGRAPFVVLPHPSGLNRFWNAPDAFKHARATLQQVFPHIEFGSLRGGEDAQA